MANTKVKKSYKFALRSSGYITFLLSVILGLWLWWTGRIADDWFFIPVIAGPVFLVCFAVIQIRVERFIYRRIKRIYDDVSLLESSPLRSNPVITDMATLTKEIEKFAKDKKIEIDTLNIREEYRKEFLGNISHELKTPLFTVQGYILTLLDGAMNDKNVRKKYLQRAAKGVERLI